MWLPMKGVLPGCDPAFPKNGPHTDGRKNGDFMELLLRRSLAQQITEETDCPVLVG